MGSKKENSRICCMCGSSPSKDPSVTLHRFPKPGSKNALRCELWAKYCFPNEAWSAPKFQDGLHSKHKMLCNKHFISSCFNEKKLFRTAVPGVQCHQVINDDYLCQERISLLIVECNNRHERNIGECQLGHDSVCKCCGIPIVGTGTQPHHLKCGDAEWTYFLKIISPPEITPTLPQHPVEPVASLSHQLPPSDVTKHAQSIRIINEGAHDKITQNLLQDPVEPMAGPSHQWLLSDVTNKEGRNDPQVENTDICGDDDDAGNDWDTLVDSNVENTEMYDDDEAVDDSDTLVDSNVCRVCLTLDVKMYNLKDIELREMFQNVTGIVVTENSHSILERLCWECAGRLKAAAGFRNKALISAALLQGLADTGEQIKKSYITSIKENADYLKSAGSLSVVEAFRTVEIEPENESVSPISESNDSDIVQNIVRKDSMELAEVFEDGHYQMDVEDESIIEDDHIICPNTGETNSFVVNNVPFREDTPNSAYSSPQVEPKKRILGYLRKTSSDCEDITKKPVIKITKSDLISKIVYRKSNPVIDLHHTLVGDVKLKNINVKVGGICKKASNVKLVKKSQVKRNTSTDKECMSLEKK